MNYRTTALALGLALSLPLGASAQTLGVNLVTAHWGPERHGLNPVNPGAYYIDSTGAYLGAYVNSYRRTSVQLGYQWSPTALPRFSLGLALVTGYAGLCPPFCRAVTPMLTPSYLVPLSDSGLGLRLSSPNLQGVHLSLEYRLTTRP